MRLLILYNKQHKNDYTAGLHTLIKDVYQRQNYTIEMADSLSRRQAVLPDNTLLFAKGMAATFLLSKPLQQLQLKAFIRKNKIDLLVAHVAGFPGQQKIPQLLIADNIEKLPKATAINHSNISVLTYSAFAKQVLTDKGFTNTIHVIPFFAPDSFRPVSWSIKQQVKMDHAQGKEFFFISRDFKSTDAVLNVLKAFSGFKKWQHSTMKLIIAGHLFIPPDDWNEKLSTYKYREDVVFYSRLTEQQKANLFAAAYASIHLPETDAAILPLLYAMQCHTPVIASETASIKEYAATAILTVLPEDADDLAQKMILIYKDENLRSKLIAASALQAGEYTEAQAGGALQSSIQQLALH